VGGNGMIEKRGEFVNAGVGRKKCSGL